MLDQARREDVLHWLGRRLARPWRELRPELRLEDDLFVTGPAAVALLRSFATEFGVDMTAFDYDRHFAAEEVHTPLDLLILWLLAPFGRGRSLSPRPVTVGMLLDAVERGRWPAGEAAA